MLIQCDVNMVDCILEGAMNRRDILKAAGGFAAAGGLAACEKSPKAGSSSSGPVSANPGAANPGTADPLLGTSLMKDVETYVGFGIHRSGGAGDAAKSDWFAKRWKALGYDVTQTSFDLPNTDTTMASLEVGAETFEGFAQPPMAFTPAGGLVAPLATWNPKSPGDVAKRIAVIYIERPSGAPSPSADYRAAFAKARDAGAVAAVGVISGPSREIVAINTPVDLKLGIPVLLVGEREKPRLGAVMTNPQPGKLRIEGPGGMRSARNTVAKYGKTGPWLVVSTPQSGWFTCGGERGPGIAMALALSEWARQKQLPYRLCFTANSGHEWMYHGADIFREKDAPKPADTALWVHLGASYAARGYEEIPTGVQPLETANDVSVLMVSPDLDDNAKAAFAGQPGLGNPVVGTVEKSAGELTALIKEGYASYFGFFGLTALFHTPVDTASSTSAAIMEPIARSIAKLIEDRLARKA
jgi:hypothetical protein